MPRTAQPDPVLADVLRRMREQRSLTREAVAWKAGVSVATLARIETGVAAPSWDSVCRIIAAFDVTLAELAQAIEAAS